MGVSSMEGKEMEKFSQRLAMNKRKNAKLQALVLAFLRMEKRNEHELVEWNLGKAQ
jgi:hypothetical protein